MIPNQFTEDHRAPVYCSELGHPGTFSGQLVFLDLLLIFEYVLFSTLLTVFNKSFIRNVFCKYFFPDCGFCFFLLIVSFMEQKILVLGKSGLSVLTFMGHVFHASSEKLLQAQGIQSLSVLPFGAMQLFPPYCLCFFMNGLLTISGSLFSPRDLFVLSFPTSHSLDQWSFRISLELGQVSPPPVLFM